MKKVFSVLLSVVLLVVCLTGCSKNIPFDEEKVIDAAKKYGMKESHDANDRTTYVMGRLGLRPGEKDGYCFIVTDSNKYEDFTSEYVEKMTVYIHGLLGECFSEDIPINYTESMFELRVYQDKEAAKKVFNTYVEDNKNIEGVDIGEKDGYQYMIFSSGLEINEEVLLNGGIYLCDKYVLYVEAKGLDDGKTGFAYYIFKELGIADPGIKK